MRLSKKLETQLNSYKEFNENQILLHELNKALRQRDQYKEERDTLIDDLSWYKAKVSRLEREINDFDKDYEMVTTNCIYWEDKAHWLEDEKGDYKAKYIIAKLHLKDVKDENILKNNLLSEFSQHIGNKPSSSTYKYFRAKLNALEIREEPTSMSVADMQPMTELQLTKDSGVQGVPLTNETYIKQLEDNQNGL